MTDNEFKRINLGNGFTVDGNGNYYYNGKTIDDEETLIKALAQHKIYLELKMRGVSPIGDTGYYVDDNNNLCDKDGDTEMSDLGQAKIGEAAEDYRKRQEKAYEEVRTLSLPVKLMNGLSAKRLEYMAY